jgi:hypothetical protein
MDRMPSASDLILAYETMLNMFHEINLEANWFGAGDGQSRTQWKRFGGAFHQKVMEAAGVGYQSVSLCVTLHDSRAPAYENVAEASFLFSPVGKQVSFTAMIHEPYMIIGSPNCEAILAKLASIWQWEFGFSLARDSAKLPMAFISGGISRTETPEEKRRIETWYACYQPEERRKRLWDIFPYNMVGPEHLAHRLPDGRTLRALIEADADSELCPLGANLSLWKVKPDRTEAMRDKLRGTGIVITE